MEKYLILKLDQESLLHLPERISDMPFVFDTTIPEHQLQEYSQIKLIGDAFNLKVLEDILIPTDDFPHAKAAMLLKRISTLNKDLSNYDTLAFDEPGAKGSGSENSVERTDLHSQDSLHKGSDS
jgi:hypothetical protein